MEHLSSRHRSRDGQSHCDFQADVTTVVGKDISHSCVDDHEQDLVDQDFILAHLSRCTRKDVTLISPQEAHLSRRKRKDNTLISFQEVEDPIDRVIISSSKAAFSHSRNSRNYDGYYMSRSL